MIFVKDYKYIGDNEYQHAILFNQSEQHSLKNVLKRGVNTLSPSDPEIVKLIGEMEK